MTLAVRARPLVVCADDFGLNTPVNDAVLELAAAGRLSAASCLVDGAAVHDGARRLREGRRTAIDLGLHLNLTESFGDRSLRWTLPKLIGRAYARLLNLDQVRQEVRRQLTLFEDIFDAPPDHVDGHQHVHQLPGVRQMLFGELQARYPGRRPWLRSGRTPFGLLPLKPAVISFLGARTFAAEATKKGFATNGRLLGVYDFETTSDAYANHLQHWLGSARPWDLLMCHPALGNDSRDAISSARWTEYGVLASSAFEALLRSQGVTPCRLSEAATRGVPI